MQITDCRPVTTGEWLNLFDVGFRDRHGQTRAWRIASRLPEPRCVSGRFDTPDAVIIVPLHRRLGKLVVTIEQRVALGGPQYGFPAGLVDFGESVHAAARRELQEETGLEVVRVIASSPLLYSSAGLTDEALVMVYVECEGRPSRMAATGDEEIEVLLVSPQEAGLLCSDPQLRFDVKAWLVLARYAVYGTLG